MHGGTRHAGNRVNKQFKQLPADPSFTVSYSSEITAWVRKTLHDSKPNRVRYKGEHDGDLQLSFLERNRGRRLESPPGRSAYEFILRLSVGISIR